MEIACVNNVTDKWPQYKSYSALYDMLIAKYDAKNRMGVTCFEYFKDSDIVKPHFDYEKTLDQSMNPLDVSTAEEQAITLLCDLFGADEKEWAISNDCRELPKHKYKISFHFVLSTKKIRFYDLCKYMRYNKQKFPPEFDLKIYRNGINKFRMPMTKKKADDIQSLLRPHNFKDKATFHKHLLLDVRDCEFLKLEIPPEKPPMNDYEKFEQNCDDEIQSIIGTYTIVSSKETQNCEDDKGCIFYDVKEFMCGNTHKSNHNFLVHNLIQKTLKIKCHSERCKHFCKILYHANYRPTRNFELKVFHSIDIKNGQTDSYYDARQYFEQFFIYIRDCNLYYRIGYEYNQKYQFFEQYIKSVQIMGFNHDMYYKAVNPKNEKEIVQANFMRRYRADPDKKFYMDLCFQPYGKNVDLNKLLNGYFNLFSGFNYKTIVPADERHKTDDPAVDADFEFLIQHIKQHICMGNEAAYTYLMAFFANIIQNPTVVPHIVLIFFSKTHGTGKSGFCKFICNVLGPALSYFGSYDQIMEKHTNAHVGKLLNVIEEVDRYSSKRYHNQMKDFSQREKAVYNEKNRPQCSIKTYVRYIKTTNYADGVWFDAEDRRYVLYTFEKLADHEHVHRICRILNDKHIIHRFGTMLENFVVPFRDLCDWERNRPLSDDYFEMRSEDPIVQFLKDFLCLDSVCVEQFGTTEYFHVEKTDKIAITKEMFYSLYISFFTENNCINKSFKSKSIFFKTLKISYRQEIAERRFPNASRKKYYTVDLKLLWQRFFADKPFVNHHAPSK